MTIFKVMCVQPIKIDETLYSEVMISLQKNSFNYDYIKQKDQFSVPWISKFTHEYHKFKSFKPLHGLINGSTIKELLINDLSSEKYNVGGHSLVNYILINETTFDVLFDVRFYYFIIVYEMHFNIPESELLDLLSHGTSSNNLKNDLYNTIRKMLVKENDNDVNCDWVQSIKQSAIKRVMDISQNLVSKKKMLEISNKITPYSLIDIRNNTGNITFFIEASPENVELKSALIKCNETAESIKREPEKVIDNNEISYLFFGRFHTIITKSDAYYYRYAPIQFHIQYLWYLSSFYIELLDNLNNTILESNRSIDFPRHAEIINEYINNIEKLVMHNESFKLTIESDNHLVFSKIEKYWNVENSLRNAKSYISFFNDYLIRSYDRRQEKSNRRQNNILFLISCIQIITLFSVWNDYFDMQTRNYEHWFLKLSAWLPLGLSLVIGGLFLFAFKKK